MLHPTLAGATSQIPECCQAVEPSLTPKMESFINFANLRKHRMSDFSIPIFKTKYNNDVQACVKKAYIRKAIDIPLLTIKLWIH